ncbi:MAG: ATP-binding protein, partial [Actinobacteria bacterium]|nr:ATP-binding protein [Actinomycetota bacterium]
MTPDPPSHRTDIVGRGTELSRLRVFLDDIVRGPCVLMLEGEVGIGKTTLWRRGVELAGERGLRVMSSRPAPSEARLSFAGLADLLQDAADLVETLPPPQRNALEVALLLAEPAGAAPDAHAVSTAVLTVLRAAAAGGPVLVGLDDIEWLDTSTADALEFAIRRLEDEPLGLLLAARDPGASLPLSLGRHVPDERVTRLPLAPLSADELRGLLRLRLDASLARPTLLRLHAMSGGNPFYALEIARAELRGEARPTGAALPIPRTLREDLVRDRLGTLSSQTREALLYASACARPTVEI